MNQWRSVIKPSLLKCHWYFYDSLVNTLWGCRSWTLKRGTIKSRADYSYSSIRYEKLIPAFRYTKAKSGTDVHLRYPPPLCSTIPSRDLVLYYKCVSLELTCGVIRRLSVCISTLTRSTYSGRIQKTERGCLQVWIAFSLPDTTLCHLGLKG
jgi:hypothetical protein